MPRESLEQLSAIGYELVTLPKHNALPSAISSHPDSLVFSVGDRLIVDNDYYNENEEIFIDLLKKRPTLRIVKSQDKLGDKYPYDTRLNAIRLGNRLFCRLESISASIRECASEVGLELVNVKQGYPACSTLKIAENAVICADRGLCAVYKSLGISVYEIDEGGITLPPYEYGFIGGACCVLSDRVCFFGDVSAHPSYKIIEKALGEHSLVPHGIMGGALRDLGGGILL